MYTCNGGVTYGNTYMRCWIQAEHGGTHGPQTLTEAIKNSCDAFFYQYGNAAGIDAIDAVGKSLGLGEASGIELTNEASGILPSPEWLRTTHNERWSQGHDCKLFDWPRLRPGYPSADGNDCGDSRQWRSLLSAQLDLQNSGTGRHIGEETR